MFNVIVTLFSLISAQSCSSCSSCNSCPQIQIPSVPQMPICQPCQTCSLPQSNPCQILPPPRQESMNDQFRFHRDAANRQAQQDSMRANAGSSCANNMNAETCNADNAKVKLDANIRTSNNQFKECNENEFLVHKKHSRVDEGDCSSKTAKIDMDAGKSCRAAQNYNDNSQNQMSAGRDRSCRAEDISQQNADGCASRSMFGRPSCGCGNFGAACFY
ncbi:uncharacterized protein MONOS_13743 [Monocercomonoides exilis]|uniref:uncharacterized protein n=1 Tax=Monocercomonoides exilis TaxID=2049356 RepID=UPI0035599FBC|nr:hypothetical protein MONOS_13743 [Monocercomonoides exilis]|eukprot:MONOS_13743.1-p1 / transcript=MONOS_13743.1 / gene=MONOS_13743 / organism=Monocercomonoides_exilis_PA203 / gene_product=unspecified product / transcript_product=unspecified product / location=Mono_scaffold00875:21835-22485(-) / protein_length=217 / sequence_SO=supercontig / SO=protein_coding / is_pseudo=false